METIAVDIDDTLYSFGELAREVMCDIAAQTEDKSLEQKAYSLYSEWNEWRYPPDLLGLDMWLEIIDVCHQPEQILSRTPYESAAEVLTELAKENQLLYISNRADSDDVFDATCDWLDKHSFPLGQVVCTTKSKTPYLAGSRYLIDDRPKTLVEFVYDREWLSPARPQRVGFGLRQEYNSSLTDVPGIKLAPNWKLLQRFLHKEGLL